MKLKIAATGLILLLLCACARTDNPCQSQPAPEPKAVLTRPAKDTVTTNNANSHICGAVTKSGSKCTRRVKGDGTDYCWQHREGEANK